MKKRIYTLRVLLSILVPSNAGILADDQIVISADGTIQQTTATPKKKTAKNTVQKTKKIKKVHLNQTHRHLLTLQLPKQLNQLLLKRQILS